MSYDAALKMKRITVVVIQHCLFRGCYLKLDRLDLKYIWIVCFDIYHYELWHSTDVQRRLAGNTRKCGQHLGTKCTTMNKKEGNKTTPNKAFRAEKCCKFYFALCSILLLLADLFSLKSETDTETKWWGFNFLLVTLAHCKTV